MPSQEYNKDEIKALGLHEKVKHQEVLNSLAEIAAYLDWSIPSVRRSIKNFGLPATRAGLGRYISTKTLIDKWIMDGHLDLVIKHDWDTKSVHLPKLSEATKRVMIAQLEAYEAK